MRLEWWLVTEGCREDDCIGGPDLDGMIKEGLREVLSQPRPIL